MAIQLGQAGGLFNIVGVESNLFQMKFSSTYIVVKRD